MRNFDNFKKSFNRTATFIKIFQAVIFTLVIGGFIGMVVIGVWAISNPEAIGGFFGRIINGFNSVR